MARKAQYTDEERKQRRKEANHKSYLKKHGKAEETTTAAEPEAWETAAAAPPVVQPFKAPRKSRAKKAGPDCAAIVEADPRGTLKIDDNIQDSAFANENDCQEDHSIYIDHCPYCHATLPSLADRVTEAGL